MIFPQTQTQILSLPRKGGLVAITFAQTFRLKLCWRWGAACSMPRVSDIDDACGISAHYMFLSNCVVQVMRVWSLAAVLSLLRSTIRRGEGTLAGSAQIHVASIQTMHSVDSGGRPEVRVTSASRGKGSCGARVQVFGRECAVQRDRMN